VLKTPVTVIGAGAFGTAVAHLLATNGFLVCAYTYEVDVAVEINKKHTNNRYLPDCVLPSLVWATTDVSQAAKSDLFFIAVPVPFVREALRQFSEHITKDHTIIALCKGIEDETLRLPLEIIRESVGVCRLGVMSGPNFAHGLIRQEVMGTVVAAHTKKSAQYISSFLANDYVHVALSDDVTGVQLCGALKNVLGLALGLVTAVSDSDNARAYVLTQGFEEISTLVVALGGRRATVYGLAGIGDSVLSAWGAGRNRRLGELLGSGMSHAKALKVFKSPPEGLNTLRSLQQLTRRKGLSLSLLDRVYKIVYHGVSPHSILAF